MKFSRSADETHSSNKKAGCCPAGDENMNGTLSAKSAFGIGMIAAGLFLTAGGAASALEITPELRTAVLQSAATLFSTAAATTSRASRHTCKISSTMRSSAA